MNAKHNLSMSRTGVLLLLGVVLSAQPLRGQDFWHEGRNVAGLASADASGKSAEAVLYGRFTSGGFRTLSEGKTLWNAGAAAQAETHFKDLVLVGNFGFEQEFGTEMMGSMFSKPEYYPVDVLEFTPGNKSKQTYDIAGGLAWKNGSRWIPGFTARFQGINYAKRKDLRHTTYRQELELVPSVLYDADGWRIGASYLFEKTSEFIQAEQIGPAKAESYYAFLDKGLRYGTYQAWDGSGIHLAEPGVDRFPVQEFTHGAALQFSLGEFLYADTEVRFSQGEVGEKGYTWFRFPRLDWSTKVLLSFGNEDNRHSIRLSYDWNHTRLYENVIEKVSAGGVTTPSILGNNRIYNAKEGHFEAIYTWERPNGMMFQADLYIDRDKKLSTFMYPYYDLDGGTHLFGRLTAQFPLGKSWLLKTSVLAGGGAYSEQISEVIDGFHLEGDEMPRLTDWWELEQEVGDAPRVAGLLTLRYTLPRIPLYIEASFEYIHAFNVTLTPGANRQISNIQIGYSF